MTRFYGPCLRPKAWLLAVPAGYPFNSWNKGTTASIRCRMYSDDDDQPTIKRIFRIREYEVETLSLPAGASFAPTSGVEDLNSPERISMDCWE